MWHRTMSTVAVFILSVAAPVLAQDQPKQNGQPPATSAPGTPSGVIVDPAQPYRPLSSGQSKQQQKTIFEFYFERLNPRNVHWGDEIDRRVANLIDSSVRNPYFRYSAVQTGINLILVVLCWAWWDKLRQTKWIVAEQLTGALNAKRYADYRAAEAIAAHNRHMESCNRVIEENGSGFAGGRSAGEWQEEIAGLQRQLAAERSLVASLEADVKRRTELQAQVESRVTQLEKLVQERRDTNNSELLARLERAESQLGSRKIGRP